MRTAAGDIFEAETDCTQIHNMGQIASSGVNNLSYFSREARVTAPVLQNARAPVAFNASRTYVAFSMGASPSHTSSHSSSLTHSLHQATATTSPS